MESFSADRHRCQIYGCSASDSDGTAAYVQALLWYITGNQTYANNAINILNTYSEQLQGLCGIYAGGLLSHGHRLFERPSPGSLGLPEMAPRGGDYSLQQRRVVGYRRNGLWRDVEKIYAAAAHQRLDFQRQLGDQHDRRADRYRRLQR